MNASPILHIKNLSKHYGELKALDHVNININQGDFYALLGPNGAGKTTIIGSISDLVIPNNGDIIINKFDLKRQKTQAKQCLGVVPQEINLNTFEKVGQILYQQAQYYGLRASSVKDRAQYLLAKLYLLDKIDRQVSTLSGGMKRRLMIARALIHSPSILLLDEPTAGVDIEIRKSLWTFLRKENKNGLTILLTTHYLEEAEQLCNRVGLIKKGKCIFEGQMTDLLNDLDAEQLLIEIAHPEKFRANSALQQQGIVVHDHQLRVQLKKGQLLQEIIDMINKSGGNIVRIQYEESRLEQVFSMKLFDQQPNE